MEQLKPEEILLKHIQQLHQTLQETTDPQVLSDLSSRLVDAINAWSNL